MFAKKNSTRRLLAPEVLQLSTMDCGPASLKCLLEGFGLAISYDRLREACQTDVDGTSIDTLEDIANQLGLDAEQVMIPADHVTLPESKAIPGIVIVQLLEHVNHFVVAWGRVGNRIQIMNPASGRQWLSCKQLTDQLDEFVMDVPAQAWREWAGTEEFSAPLARRLRNLGASRSLAKRIIDMALTDPSWRQIAALDAATRTVTALVRSGEFKSGRACVNLLRQVLRDAIEGEPGGSKSVIPPEAWTVSASEPDQQGEPQLALRGVAVLRIHGRQAPQAHQPDESDQEDPPAATISPEHLEQMAESKPKPLRDLFNMLRADGLFSLGLLAIIMVVVAAARVLEALFFRSFIDLRSTISLVEQRLGASGMLIGFAALMLVFHFLLRGSIWRLGRQLEVRLLAAFFRKIPKLKDEYFRTRLRSDLMHRGHILHSLRYLPGIGETLLSSVVGLFVTTACIIWIDPQVAHLAVAAALFSVVVPLSFNGALSKRVEKTITLDGALTRFQFDALLGVVPARSHGAIRSIRRMHESIVTQWAKASFAESRLRVWAEFLQTTSGFAFASALVLTHINNTGTTEGMLLLSYWALNLPVLGRVLADTARLYPEQRTIYVRLLEPLNAEEEPLAQQEPLEIISSPDRHISPGVRINFDRVSMCAAGQTILYPTQFTIEPGSHVAIVGESGAGKSTLLRMLLAFAPPTSGQVKVDGIALRGPSVSHLRSVTAWVDPDVYLWNTTLLENILYGLSHQSPPDTSAILDAAQLRSVLEGLPDGFQTSLGEAGTLVSGGEGQRVRLARAICRKDVRLVLLDEAFRGLEPQRRRLLLARARKLWATATFLCVTHDLHETLDFDRVLVIDQGRLVEDGHPQDLNNDSRSRYRRMLDIQSQITNELWNGPHWRQIQLCEGKLVEKSGGAT